MFESDEVRVQGFPWCADAPRLISVASFTKKVLCQKHNSDLSQIDEAGASARKLFRQTQRIGDGYRALPTVGGYPTVLLSGRKFERWCLKTLISLSVGEDRLIGPKGSAPGKADAALVRLAFGLDEFGPDVGLYLVGTPGQEFSCPPQLRIMRLGPDDGHTIGALFIILNFRFALMLEPMGNERIYIHDSRSREVMGTSDVYYRPPRVPIRVRGVDWVFLFEW